MTLSHGSLVRRFHAGEKRGKSSTMSIRQLEDGWTALVGYGHAAYAVRAPSGIVVVFDGWANRNTRRMSGTMTTKANHFPHLWGEKVTFRVAYSKTSTPLEKSAKANADIVTEEPTWAAPKVYDALQSARTALDQVETFFDY